MPVRLLFADDEPDVRLVCRTQLRRHDCEIVEVATGREAVDVAGVQQFDIIVLDQRMPELSGLGAAEELRKAGYEGPLLLFSGYLDDATRQRATELELITLDKADIGRLPGVIERLTRSPS